MVSKIGHSTYSPSFAGNKDIVIIDDRNLEFRVKRMLGILGDKKDEYTIHTALGGDEGLKKVKELNKKGESTLVVTAYNMPPWMGPARGSIISKLKTLNTKVIVDSSNWNSVKDPEKAGVKKCEEECGADKFVNNDYYLLKDVVNSILDGKKIPRYDFQNK